jgi:C1A family cysteine protease
MVNLKETYKQWCDEYGKDFDRDRFDIFVENHYFIKDHNDKDSNVTLSHNVFSDMDFDEFRNNYIGNKIEKVVNFDDKDIDVSSLDESVDWSETDAVTAVKNQGQCGSCWSFSTTGALEGAYWLKFGVQESFSEQMLVDCDTYDSGCNGGLMDNAFKFIKENGGLCKEADYEYTGSDDTCKTSCEIVKDSKVSSWTDVGQTESSLMTAVSKQPVAIAIEADQRLFQFYRSGVLSANSCGDNLDHGVLLVGYGNEGGTDYWKIKNSWGDSWGDDGYIKVERGESSGDNACGILLSASYPVL